MTLFQLVQEGKRILETQGIDEAELDARYLLMHVCNLTYSQYILQRDNLASPTQKEKYINMIQKRGTHMPLQHLTGCQEFMGFPFLVNKHVLIPRQDTECLVEEVLKYTKGKKVLDMCTGSGCIAISIFLLGEPSEVTAVDISEEALKVAGENADRLEAKVHLVRSDLFCKIQDKYDMIVSNPPYIRTEEIAKCMPEVRDYEPRLALDGSQDGLKFYRKIIQEAAEYLNPDGMLCFEIGYDQADEVKAQMDEFHFQEICIHKDLAGLNRMITGKLREVRKNV